MTGRCPARQRSDATSGGTAGRQRKSRCMGSFKSSVLAASGRPALTSALIVGLYYVVPVTPGAVGAWLAVRIIGAIAVGSLVTWLIVQQVSHQFADPEE